MGFKRIRKIFYIKERKRETDRDGKKERELLMSITAAGNSSRAVSAHSLANDSSFGTHMSMSVGPTR